jgi:hypothetical protein
MINNSGVLVGVTSITNSASTHPIGIHVLAHVVSVQGRLVLGIRIAAIREWAAQTIFFVMVIDVML